MNEYYSTNNCLEFRETINSAIAKNRDKMISAAHNVIPWCFSEALEAGNGLLMSRNILSTACMQNLCCTGASSQTSKVVSFIKSPRCVPFRILQTAVASMLMGSLNLECAVLPPSSRVEAIPEEATARVVKSGVLGYPVLF